MTVNPTGTPRGTIGYASELAELELQTDQAMQRSEEQMQRAARQAKLAHDENEVHALREKASTQLTGAVLSAGLAGASAGMQFGAASVQYKADMDQVDVTRYSAQSTDSTLSAAARDEALDSSLQASSAGAGDKLTAARLTAGGKALDAASTATGLIYGSRASTEDADAAEERHKSEEASWRADDAGRRRDRVQADSDKKMSMVEQIIASDAEASRAILQRA